MSSTPAGTTMGLKDSECGQMGVTMMAGTLGWIMEAPAAAAYAVLPVGVDTITPVGRKRGDIWFESTRLRLSAHLRDALGAPKNLLSGECSGI